MKDFFAFLKSKYFFIHLTISVLLVVIACWILIKMLNSYTRHGETIEVPDFNGKKISELKGFVEGKEIRYQIIDSIYAPKEEPGTVLRQDPEAKSLVKRNRTVYLYVTGMLPPQVIMPKLVDRSERQAILMLESYGLKIGKVEQVRGDCNGCVLEQTIRGKPVEPGTKVNKGTVINLKIGKKENYIAPADSSNSGGLNFN
jgi:eukaryotic-like serine/threonine-protein kinase